MTRTLVVVGHGMTGHRLVETVRTLDPAGHWHIVVLAEERDPAYDRVRLAAYLGGRSRSELSLVEPDFLTDPRVDLCTARPAVHVDRRARTVRTADGDEIGYDALVLATGSRPFVPPVPGRELRNCFVQRTLDDVDDLRAAVRGGRPAVVVGGGLLGLEAAHGLRLLGMHPHIVEFAPHLMPTQLDTDAAQVLQRGAAALGLQLHCGTAVTSVDAGPDDAVRSVTLANGTVLDADLVVFAAGIRPRDDLAVSPDLERGERGGFLVDAYCRTTDEHIWAVGECAAVLGRCHGLVAPGYRMAESVARQLTGHATEPFDGTDTSTALKLLGIHVATFGTAPVRDSRAVEVTFTEGTTRYAKVFLQPTTGTLLGGILAGETGSRTELASHVGRHPPANLERLLLPD
ncbi:NAD(P)/FAD-dependent oxidoreductase [Streptomyces sp. NPDC006365]|uniref:NAD(P)/FAD-dependent oxidoreductase n=1 Tax=Streptomyces sp. NPDC006365 TaxID=3364744 RepID=UPI00368B71C4